ncbi:hypothetical protein Tco_0927450, partial [Tanacetum coccineum]
MQAKGYQNSSWLQTLLLSCRPAKIQFAFACGDP